MGNYANQMHDVQSCRIKTGFHKNKNYYGGEKIITQVWKKSEMHLETTQSKELIHVLDA